LIGSVGVFLVSILIIIFEGKRSKDKTVESERYPLSDRIDYKRTENRCPMCDNITDDKYCSFCGSLVNES
jgi:hypothetical protein